DDCESHTSQQVDEIVSGVSCEQPIGAEQRVREEANGGGNVERSGKHPGNQSWCDFHDRSPVKEISGESFQQRRYAIAQPPRALRWLAGQGSPSDQSEIPSSARSWMRTCPGTPERAGKPPALGSQTPGVVARKLRVVRNIPTARALPTMDIRGQNGRAA